MSKRVFLSIFFICSCLLLKSQQISYKTYDNIGLILEAISINCFAQDNQGLVWIGSNKGLFSYDGFSAQDHSSDSTNTHVHCIIVKDEDTFILGTDKGIFFYDLRQDKYTRSEIDFKGDVRAMVLDKDLLWIGSLSGLSKYNFSTKSLTSISQKENPEIPHEAVYAIEMTEDGKVYVGTYNGMCYYDPKNNEFNQLKLPSITNKSNQFINAILRDSLHNCIWIGTEGNLFRYDSKSAQISTINYIKNNSVKSLVLDEDGMLLAGTDNGLYVYDAERNQIQHVAHDSRNTYSLSNNIVWTIFRDKEDNIWLGTDYNISLARNNKLFRSVPISEITGVGEGNRFHAIYRDSKKRFWLGGTNGLIQKETIENKNAVRWFRMGNPQYSISHNRIRQIYEDKDNNIWLATDGSINRFDEKTDRFINYSIIDSTNVYNANWAYDIIEDKDGYLWITCFLGGVFVVDKQKLIEAKGTYIADRHYTVKDGLSGSHASQIIEDRNGNKWVLLYNHGINKIDLKTNKVHRIQLDDATGLNDNPNYILIDKEGDIWAGRRNTLIKIDAETYATRKINLDVFGECEVHSMIESGKNIWLSTSNGILAVDKENYSIVQRINVSSNSYTTGFYDKYSGDIYWGASDEIAILSPASIDQYTRPNEIVLTSLQINGQPYQQVVNTKSSIRYLDKIDLKYKQNNLIFEFSDLIYSQAESNKFVYRLEGLDNSNWSTLPANRNRLVFNNLEYGRYSLVISSLDFSGKPSDNTFTFSITINPPWYYTIWAKLIYSLLIIGLIIWIINFFRVRNNLRIERLEKAKTVELTNLKLDFFTNVSHEFKTPLSLIIAPVSKLLLEIKSPEHKDQLNTVLRNALSLNSLIRQVIDFNREERISSALILSQIEFVEFAKSLFSIYEDGYRDKGLKFNFRSDADTIYVNADVLKMEAILNNLLSNACKYTSEGEINLILNQDIDHNCLKITVSDTGVGIPQKEQRYVFERFFQSSKTVNDKEGTGIGLYLIKSYVEQHQGTLELVSQEDEGTTIKIIMPIIKTERQRSEESAHTIINESAPLILIVEDNPEIADFIATVISKNYRCEICYNGKQGLKKTLELQPDLVVSDIMMPIMDGLEMAKQIRRNVPVSDTPIILLTAKDDRSTELESINLKVDGFIAKPFDPEILVSRIAQILESKRLVENKIRLESITEVEPIKAVSPDEKFLSEITSIIEDRIDDPELSVNALSEISGYGTKQLYRKTKQLTGKTPVEYIRTIRLKKASMLLVKKSFTISEIMYMVGFSNSSYFSKCFHQEFGMTPSQFIDANSTESTD